MRLFAGLRGRCSVRACKLPRLNLLALEDRTVPTSVTVVPVGQTANNVTTFLTLDAALPVAGTGGTVTVEQGAAAATTSIIEAGVTIQGDLSVPSSALPAFNLTVNDSGVVLKNLNLSSVSVNASMTTITRSAIGSIEVNGPSSGSDMISQNNISGLVAFSALPLNSGISSSGSVSDQVLNNTFVGSSGLVLQQVDNVLVQGNNFSYAGASYFYFVPPFNTPYAAISIASSSNVVITDNVVRLPASTMAAGTAVFYSAIAVAPTVAPEPAFPDFIVGPVSTGTISNNVLSTGSTGTGLFISSSANDFNSDADTKFLVQSNDFSDNAIGVYYSGSGGSTVRTDLGGGGLNSLGGNDFRSFLTTGSSTGGAIVAIGLGNGAVLTAQSNSFGNVIPSNVVFVQQPSGGTATIDVSSPLTKNYVQVLYQQALGRSPSTAEQTYWFNVGSTDGMAAIANGIQRSDEAHARLVDGWYISYLGRAADAAGLQYFVTLLQTETEEQALAALLASSEYYEHAPAVPGVGGAPTDQTYVQSLFEQLLGHAANPDALSYWQAQVAAEGRAAAALDLMGTTEYRTDVVLYAYRTLLHRSLPPGAAEVNYWLSIDLNPYGPGLLSGTLGSVITTRKPIRLDRETLLVDFELSDEFALNG
jgi:hypothetical protein